MIGLNKKANFVKMKHGHPYNPLIGKDIYIMNSISKLAKIARKKKSTRQLRSG